MIKKFNFLFITLFKVGKLKFAPGTFASLLTCLFFLLLSHIVDITTILLITLIIFSYSFFAINNSVDSFDDNDPQEIVIDEVVGQLLPLLAIPIYETLYPAPTIFYCVFSFFLFRLFDIWKPFPISYIDNNTNGALGIMLDDIVAGMFSTIFLIIVFFYIGG
jgi:phosphatidylglycerophosphatase A